jgi:CubicO group peptidase (beta-lactamase class C family)
VTPEAAGWSEAKLSAARVRFAALPGASLLVVDRGKVVVEWGDPAKRVKVSSVRKSFLSALYGIAESEGKVNLDRTLGELGIDDQPPLEAAEKRATVRMLLQARSGVYHGYAAGTPGMRVSQPRRESHEPGTHWYYNNWDFNALGSIFEKLTGTKIAAAFEERLAKPLGMEDFRLEDMYYEYSRPNADEQGQSIHPAYHFRLSARDMARFGYLFLRQGKWQGQQIVPAKWVAESTASYSKTADSGGYGYLWWVDGLGAPVKTYSAQGALAKYIVVIPERDLVIVYQNHVEFPDAAKGSSEEQIRKLPAATKAQFGTLVKLLLTAQR